MTVPFSFVVSCHTILTTHDVGHNAPKQNIGYNNVKPNNWWVEHQLARMSVHPKRGGSCAGPL